MGRYYRKNPYDRSSDDEQTTQKHSKAVALGYDMDQDDAPKVLASGRGAIAEKIIALAKANHIPIQEDPILVSALETLDVGSTIPPELYLVVAEVFAYVYRIKERHNQKKV